MKKAIGQTVRDLKREVNKKVLKVPSIEQKVLDATSNEPWGPHGSLLADIAQATRNYHEYQMIMSVIWKRTNDTGKNWRHVYKALTVLEYLVAHGSERVIEDIREHAYQISTLSDFQYIDSSGRDQGNNVRKKSQSLVVLVNDKERIQEVRQKAAANRDKYRSTPMGSMYRPGSYSGSGGYGDRYDEDRYEGRYGYRDDDRNGYGRERDGGSRDDDRYGRYGDSYGREGDRYGRDYEERYGRDAYRDDDYRGRGQSIDDYHYGSRSRSVEGDRNRANEDDGQYSSRGSGARADDQSQDGSTTGKGLDRKYSGQSFGAPPSYEDAVGATRSPTYSERDGESSQAYAPKASSPPAVSPTHTTTAAASPPASASPPAAASPPAPASASAPASVQATAQHSDKEVDGFDEFDPRGSFSAAPTTSNGTASAASAVEMDLLGSLTESFSSNSLALVPASQPEITSEANASGNSTSGPPFVAAPPTSMINNQPFDDPFGDGPFRAVPSSDGVSLQQQTMSTDSFNTNSSQSLDASQPVPQKAATDFGGNFYDATYLSSGPGAQPPTSTPFGQHELSTPNQDVDILADILPPSAPSSFVNTQAGYPVQPSQSVSQNGFPQPNQSAAQPGLPSLPGQDAPQNSFQAQNSQPAGFPPQLGQPSIQTSYPLQSAESVSQASFGTQTMALTFPVQASQASQMGFHSQTGSSQPNPPNPNIYGTYHSQSVSTGPTNAYMAPPSSTGPATQHNFLSQSGSAVPIASQGGPQAPQVQSSSFIAPVSTTPSSTVSNEKFETKSTVWADTLSRGLVNLNISGSKTNPLADIGVDFDAINRKERRMEKPTTNTVTSTVTMGKAMGAGSGMGRAGATVLRPPQNPMMGSGMNMGMTGVPGGAGMGMGGYGVNQPMGRGMGMGLGMGMGMGMGMNMPSNMGMGQGVQMQQQQMGFAPGSAVPGGYNNMMGPGTYGQQPYGGGYR
ncbi:Equilibrative nucleoside transporter protein [Handroanthus impetiginosus]|uniref:Equilibrative nucleoside transporter protein n=1 Tax=Handroanthus impetiginosus TaxID=429701 RepID=A0A2G9HW29_9LAMI|nr:Equilibrative nucleoside transporter protein [Handroanthus impetiginosus]